MNRFTLVKYHIKKNIIPKMAAKIIFDNVQ